MEDQKTDAKLRERLRDCAEALNDLRSAWSRGTERLPVSTGVFVSESDRKASYRALCSLLIGVQDADTRLRGEIAELTSIDRTFFERLTRTDAVNAESMINAWTKYQAVRDAWVEFYEGAVTVYAQKICDAADMEHEGVSCDPRAVVRLCGEMIACLDVFSRRVREDFTV